MDGSRLAANDPLIVLPATVTTPGKVVSVGGPAVGNVTTRAVPLGNRIATASHRIDPPIEGLPDARRAVPAPRLMPKA